MIMITAICSPKRSNMTEKSRNITEASTDVSDGALAAWAFPVAASWRLVGRRRLVNGRAGRRWQLGRFRRGYDDLVAFSLDRQLIVHLGDSLGRVAPLLHTWR